MWLTLLSCQCLLLQFLADLPMPTVGSTQDCHVTLTRGQEVEEEAGRLWFLALVPCLSAADKLADDDTDNTHLSFLSSETSPASERQKNNAGSTGTTPNVRECDLFVVHAVKLAVEHVNVDPLILPSVPLNVTMLAFDQDVDLVTASLAHMLQRSAFHGIIGPDESSIAERSAYLSDRHLDTLQVSYGSSDPAFSEYSHFHSLSQDIDHVLYAKIWLLLQFTWLKVGVISSETYPFTKYTKLFSDTFKAVLETRRLELDVTYVEHFSDSPDLVLAGLRDSNVTIIFGNFEASFAREVLCKAAAYSLNTSNHVWILPPYHNPSWWELSPDEISELPTDQRCSNTQVLQVLEQSFVLDVFGFSDTNNSHYPLSLSQFKKKMLLDVRQDFPSLTSQELEEAFLHSHATYAYDAVWSLAMAWHRAILNDDDCSMENVKLSLENNTSFDGYSGSYVQHLRSEVMVLASQFINSSLCPVALYSKDQSYPMYPQYLQDTSIAKSLEINACNFTWKGDTQPHAGSIDAHHSFGDGVLIALCMLVVTCLVFEAVMLFLQVFFKNNSHIKITSLKLNVIIILLSMVVQLAPIFIGLITLKNRLHITDLSATIMCQYTLWSNVLSFTFIASILLMKNWRIYKIFHNKRLKIEGMDLSDHRLLLYGSVFLLPAVITLVVWTLLDALRVETMYLETDLEREYTIASTNYTVCSSTYMDFWEVGIGLYNSLLLFLMLFLACQNARIPQHFREVNDNTHRVTLAIFIIVEFFFLLHILFKHVLNAGLFWIYYTAFPVTLTLAIAFTLFIPPLVAILIDRRWRKYVRRATIERQQDLKKEVESLRKQLSQKEKRIKELKTLHSKASARTEL